MAEATWRRSWRVRRDAKRLEAETAGGALHIAILIGHFPPGVVGGAELQAQAWARLLADRHRVTVITRRDPPSQAAEEGRDGFTVRRLPVSRIPLWRTVRDLLGVEREIARLAPRPDLLLCFQTFVSGMAGVRAQARLGIPAVVWVRSEGELRLGLGERWRWISPRVWRAARGVLVQSERARAALLQALRELDARAAEEVAAKLDVVPNGLDLPPPSPAGGKGVLAVGRLIPEKGMDIVIEAAARASLPLTVVGDGPERPRLEGIARARGGLVRFEGMVGPDRLARLYRECACVVLAARAGEGLPNVLLEAMGHTRPVVATPILGVSDLVQDGCNGLLIPPGDAGALAAALLRLEGDDGLRARLSTAARATAEKFAWDRVRPRLEAVLERHAQP